MWAGGHRCKGGAADVGLLPRRGLLRQLRHPDLLHNLYEDPDAECDAHTPTVDIVHSLDMSGFRRSLDRALGHHVD